MIQTENFPFNLPALFFCSSPEETFAAGKELARLLKKGSVVALRGPLGAGKTCFAKGIAAGLGIGEELTSPTYTIVSEYEGFLAGEGASAEGGESVQVFHIDAYRLGGSDDFSAIGGEELVFGKGVSIIEWSERVPDFIPETAFHADIELAENNKRLVRVYRGQTPEGNGAK